MAKNKEENKEYKLSLFDMKERFLFANFSIILVFSILSLFSTVTVFAEVKDLNKD